MDVTYKTLSSLVNRKIGYGIVQPGDSVPNGIPVIKVFNILAGLKSIDTLDTTKAENSEKYARTKLNGGELIVSVVGTVGKTAIVPTTFAGCNLVRATALIDIPDGTIALWVKYYIDSPDGQLYINTNLNTTVQPTLNIKSLESMPIPFFESDYIKKAVSILSGLDEKIKLNTAINENLEQQAHSIFVEMFVNSGHCQPATIADVSVNVTDGVHNTVKDDISGEYLLLSCKNIKGGTLSIGQNERHINKATFDKLRKRTQLAKGDILLSSVGTVGEILLLNTTPLNFEFQRSVAMIKPNVEMVSSVYVYESLLYRKAELINMAHGAVQQCLFISDISEFPIDIPQSDMLIRFNNVVIPIFDTITSNQMENQRLAALRDTLLPKLMSGEIDVSKVRI